MPALARSVTTHRQGHRPPPQVLVKRWAVVIAGIAALVIVVSLISSSGSAKPRHTARGATNQKLARSGGTAPTATTRAVSGQLVAMVARWHLTSPASRAVVLSDGSDILVLGGLTTGDVSSAAVQRVQPGPGVSGVAGDLSVAVHDAGGAHLGSHFVVFGGGAGTSLASVQSWSRTTSSVIGALPTARSDLSAATVGGVAYVLGGFDGQKLQSQILATSDGVTFRDAGALRRPARYAAVASWGGKVWIIGGDLGSSESAGAGGQTNDIQVFDPGTATTTVVGHMPAPLGHAMAFVLGGQLYVAGGLSAGVTSSKIWRISPTGTARVTGELPYAVSNAGAVVIAGTASIVGGETAAGPASPLKSVIQIRVADG